MHNNYITPIFTVLIVVLFTLGCGTLSTPTLNPTQVASLTPGTDAATTVPTATSSPEPIQDTATPVPTPTELPIETYVAFIQGNALLVTHVMSGQPLDTQKIIESPEEGGIFDISWSPSGEYLSFTMFVSSSEYHIFVVNVLKAGTPVDLGLGNGGSWSPDSKLFAFEQEYELKVYSPGNGQTRRLTIHLGVKWLWSTPVFTPAGDALVAAGSLSYSDFKLFRIPLDGSAANTYPPNNFTPSITTEISGRPPTAMRFSPNGQTLAFIASENVDACDYVAEFAIFAYSRVVSHYYLTNADGSDLHELSMASLAPISNPDQMLYFYGDSLVWTPESDGMWVNGLVRNCGEYPNTTVGGPQISRVTLDGQEHEIIPGAYSYLSLDHSGTLLGVVNRASSTPHVQILGLDGHLVLDLGEGDRAVLQP